MEISTYIQLLQYLRVEKRAVSPHELSITLHKSRVTIQSSLKRLLKNGWVEKVGESPKTMYRALELSILPRTATEILTKSHETQEKDKKALQQAAQAQHFGLLEQFIYKTNN